MSSTKPDPANKLIAENRRALMRYTVDERIEVGVVLVGSEVKSIRAGKIELNDAYANIERGEMWLVNAFVHPYAFARSFGHEPKRTRKLLANRAEIDKLDTKIRQKGYTLVPLKVYLKGGHVKLELGLAKGKATHDRREEIKAREGDREARAAMARGRKGE